MAVLGGDGSLGCFLDMITKDSTVAKNLKYLFFAPLPFGNGNDICISTGWGKAEGEFATDFEFLVRSLIDGTKDRLAIWECEF